MELEKEQERVSGFKAKIRRLPRWLKWVVGIIAVLTAAVVIIGPKLKNTTVMMDTTKIAKQDLKRSVISSGRLESANKQEFFTPVDSTLMELNVEVGDRVKKGQVLGRLDTLELGRQYEDAKAKLAGREADLAKAKAKDDKLALKEAETRFNKAKNNLERKTYLFKEGAIVSEEVETAKAEYVEAETRYKEASTIFKERASLKEVSSLQAQVDLAIQEVAQAKERLDLATFVAGSDGVVLFIGAEKGNRVMEGSQILVVGNDETLEVTANVNEMDAGSLKEGQPVEITCPVLPGERYQGQVSRVAAAAIIQKSNAGEMVSVPVTVKISEKTEGLKLGYTVDLAITVMKKENVLMVPIEAIFNREGKKFVYVVENGTAQERQIETKTGNELYDMVISGLEEGNEIILNPPPVIKNNQKVTTRSAGENND